MRSAFFNPSLMQRLIIPLLGATLVGILFIVYLYKQTTLLAIETEPPSNNPLALHEALKLGVLFGVIFGAIGVLQAKFGDSGIYLVSFLAGVTDVDAITLSLSQLALSSLKQEMICYPNFRQVPLKITQPFDIVTS